MEKSLSSSPRTRGWGPGSTRKDSERQHVLGTVDVGRHLSLPHY